MASIKEHLIRPANVGPRIPPSEDDLVRRVGLLEKRLAPLERDLRVEANQQQRQKNSVRS
jgi:hypothetical protein